MDEKAKIQVSRSEYWDLLRLTRLNEVLQRDVPLCIMLASNGKTQGSVGLHQSHYGSINRQRFCLNAPQTPSPAPKARFDVIASDLVCWSMTAGWPFDSQLSMPTHREGHQGLMIE